MLQGFFLEDPIGLAGGLNVYGFAGGDPVNFSDPFGLCPNPTALGFGSLRCVVDDFIAGAQSTLSRLTDAVGNTSVFIRGGMGTLTTQAEVRGDGAFGVRTGPSVGTSAIGASIGVRYRIQSVPADAVEVRLNKTVAKVAGLGISIGGTEAINAKGEHALTSLSVEAGWGYSRTSTGRALPVSGSVKIHNLESCFGSICQ